MPTHQRKLAPRQRAACRWRLMAGAGLALLSAAAAAAEPAWTTAIKSDPETRQSRCLLTSEAQITTDGYDSTPVSLVFNGGSLLVVTESELDPSFKDLQLVVDNKLPVHSDKIVHKKTLVFGQDTQALVQQLRAGRLATVYLRFWPTWPATQAFPVRFSLKGFSKAYDALGQQCQSPAN